MAARRLAVVVVLGSALVGLSPAPLTAQQPYPPPPPPDGEPGQVELSCDIDSSREIACEGEGYLEDSQVNVEIRRTGQPSEPGGGNLEAAFVVQADGEGEIAFDHQLDCSYRANGVLVRASGRDAEDRPATNSERLDVPPPPEGCQQVEPAGQDSDQGGVGGEGTERPAGEGPATDGAARGGGGADQRGTGVLGAVDRQPDGSLAVTGRNLVLLLAVALVTLALGAVLVTARRQRVSTIPPSRGRRRTGRS